MAPFSLSLVARQGDSGSPSAEPSGSPSTGSSTPSSTATSSPTEPTPTPSVTTSISPSQSTSGAAAPPLSSETTSLDATEPATAVPRPGEQTPTPTSSGTGSSPAVPTESPSTSVIVTTSASSPSSDGGSTSTSAPVTESDSTPLPTTTRDEIEVPAPSSSSAEETSTAVTSTRSPRPRPPRPTTDTTSAGPGISIGLPGLTISVPIGGGTVPTTTIDGPTPTPTQAPTESSPTSISTSVSETPRPGRPIISIDIPGLPIFSRPPRPTRPGPSEDVPSPTGTTDSGAPTETRPAPSLPTPPSPSSPPSPGPGRPTNTRPPPPPPSPSLPTGLPDTVVPGLPTTVTTTRLPPSPTPPSPTSTSGTATVTSLPGTGSPRPPVIQAPLPTTNSSTLATVPTVTTTSTTLSNTASTSTTTPTVTPEVPRGGGILLGQSGDRPLESVTSTISRTVEVEVTSTTTDAAGSTATVRSRTTSIEVFTTVIPGGPSEIDPAVDPAGALTSNGVSKQAIIGGAVGSVVFILIMVFASFVLLRRRKNRKEMEFHSRLFEKPVVESYHPASPGSGTGAILPLYHHTSTPSVVNARGGLNMNYGTLPKGDSEKTTAQQQTEFKTGQLVDFGELGPNDDPMDGERDGSLSKASLLGLTFGGGHHNPGASSHDKRTLANFVWPAVKGSTPQHPPVIQVPPMDNPFADPIEHHQHQHHQKPSRSGSGRELVQFSAVVVGSPVVAEAEAPVNPFADPVGAGAGGGGGERKEGGWLDVDFSDKGKEENRRSAASGSASLYSIGTSHYGYAV